MQSEVISERRSPRTVGGVAAAHGGRLYGTDASLADRERRWAALRASMVDSGRRPTSPLAHSLPQATSVDSSVIHRHRSSASSEISADVENTSARRKFPKHLVETYDIRGHLGSGAFSTVMWCVHRTSGQVRAVKKINTSELTPRAIAHEIALMKLLRHPNVVRCYDVFLEGDFVNIVVDMFAGGDLIDGLNVHRQSIGRVPDGQLAHISRHMVAAIVHVHGLCIVHRDVKGENFLLDRPDIGDPECVVALADFGTAEWLEPGEKLTEKVGTQQFWAPEVHTGQYDFLADIWAIGVTTFVLLTGNLPFQNEEEICKPLEPGTLPIVPPSFATPLCVDFIATCLAKDPIDRQSAVEVSRHAWMDTPVDTRRASQSMFVSSAISGVASGLCVVLACFLECLSGVCLDLLARAEPSDKRKKDSPR